MYLLDTNIISEPTKPIQNTHVLEWLDSIGNQFFISAASIEELRYGISLLPEGKRKANLDSALLYLNKIHASKIVPFSLEEALVCGELRAAMKKSGRNINIRDLMIASTALTHHLVVATRNVRDFEGLGVQVFNPFEEPAAS